MAKVQVRCPECDKLLYVSKGQPAPLDIEIKCPRCGTVSSF